MSPTTKHIMAGGAAFLLWGATSLAASANYLGYANGDPQNWGFYEEQHNGASPPAEGVPAAPYARPIHHGRVMYLGRTPHEGNYDNGMARRAPRY
jgi:hypothetical protein